MSLPDLVNGTFEMLAGVAILNHCRALYRAKQSRGVSILSVGFFFSWGLWNLFYYPHLKQPISFYGGLGVVSANLLWVGMLLYYRYYERRR